jgi:hypothetical protein
MKERVFTYSCIPLSAVLVLMAIGTRRLRIADIY